MIPKEHGNWQVAIEGYRQCLKLEPTNVEAMVKLGVLLAEHEQIDQAIKLWQTVVRINPGHFPAIHNLGVAFAQIGDPEESIRQLRRALELKPDYAEAHYNLANVLNVDAAAGKLPAMHAMLSKESRRQEAAEHYLAAVRIQPKYAEACHNLGALLIDLQRSAEAIVWLRHGLRIIKADHRAVPPNLAQTLFPSVLNQLGLAMTAAARYREAERCYRRALNVKPEMAEAHSNLGNLYQEQGRLPEALASYELAIALDTKSTSTPLEPVVVHPAER